MKVIKIWTLLLFSLMVTKLPLYSEMCARVDVGGAAARIDILESGKTVKRLNMGAIKGDATIMFSKESGFCIKPAFLYGRNGNSHLFSGGAGIGYYIPIQPFFGVTPVIGCNWTELETRIDLPFPTPAGVVLLEDVKETFRSISPYLGVDVTYRFSSSQRVYLIVQYAISRTKTILKDVLTSKSRTQGFNYAIEYEQDLSARWSFNVAAAYNLSLTKEKHGLRGAGVKLGLTYWW